MQEWKDKRNTNHSIFYGVFLNKMEKIYCKTMFKKDFRARLSIFIVLLFLPFEIFCQSSPSYSEKTSIRDISDKYQAAIKSSDGKKLIPLVSENSIQFYSELKNLALWASPEQLFQEEIYVIMSTLMLRKVHNFSQLSSLSPQELIIDNYTGQSSSLNEGEVIEISKMNKIDSNRIIVNYKSSKGVSGPDLAYIRENGEWKVNLEDQMSLMFFPIQLKYTQLAQEGFSKEEFIIYLTQSMSGMNSMDIIQPLNNQ